MAKDVSRARLRDRDERCGLVRSLVHDLFALLLIMLLPLLLAVAAAASGTGRSFCCCC